MICYGFIGKKICKLKRAHLDFRVVEGRCTQSKYLRFKFDGRSVKLKPTNLRADSVSHAEFWSREILNLDDPDFNPKRINVETIRHYCLEPAMPLLWTDYSILWLRHLSVQTLGPLEPW
jgi:hypothetical protein